MRGTAQPIEPAGCCTRFIPACAGNSTAHRACRVLHAVHPRVCGEQRLGKARRCTGIGSSPRVRGTATDSPSKYQTHRFIPACAGNRQTSSTNPERSTVHPRVCGEQSVSRKSTISPGGSSPRVRGTGNENTRALHPGRFIPACAGNRYNMTRFGWSLPVHPRVCGEQIFQHPKLFSNFGSSPRVRGTDILGFTCVWFFRFIPACAGNRLAGALALAVGAVHPRVCGEQDSAVILARH